MRLNLNKCYEAEECYYIFKKNYKAKEDVIEECVSIEEEADILVGLRNKKPYIVGIAFGKGEWSRNMAIDYCTDLELFIFTMDDYKAIESGQKQSPIKCCEIEVMGHSDDTMILVCDATTEKKPIAEAIDIFKSDVLDVEAFDDYSANEESIVPDNGTIKDYFLKWGEGKSSDELVCFIEFLNDIVCERIEASEVVLSNIITKDEDRRKIFDIFSANEKRQLADFAKIYYDEYEYVLRYEILQEHGNNIPMCLILGSFFLDEITERETEIKVSFLPQDVKNELITLCDAILRNENPRTVIIQTDDTSDATVYNLPDNNSARKSSIMSYLIEHYGDECFFVVREYDKGNTKVYGLSLMPFDRWQPISSYEMKQIMTTLPNGKVIPAKKDYVFIDIKRKKF